MAVRVAAKDTFSTSRTEPLSHGNYLRAGHFYDVMPDGRHFVFIQVLKRTTGQRKSMWWSTGRKS